MDQTKILEIINQYNSTDRQIIKANLRRLMFTYDIKPSNITELGFALNNVYAWTNQTSNNIPMFEQALKIASRFDFDVQEFLK